MNQTFSSIHRGQVVIEIVNILLSKFSDISTLRGQKENTGSWKQTKYHIENNKNQIEKYYQKIEEIES